MPPLEIIHVLHVEDDQDTVDTVRMLLESRKEVKFEVEDVGRVTEAVDKLKEGGIDAVLLDLTLPDSKGLDAVEKVVSAAPDVDVVVLTGAADMEEKSKRAGAAGYISKSRISGVDMSRKLQYVVIHRRSKEEKHELEKALEELGSVILRLTEIVANKS